jgi:hypothetical protein
MDQPRFCYVLTTNGRDVFTDMTYALVAFLRHAHPEFEMICLFDAFSHRASEAARQPLLDAVDRASVVGSPGGPHGYRNPFVKTQMRHLLEGNLVYFDSDTLVVDRLDGMLACPSPMPVVPNRSRAGDPWAIYVCERAIFEMMGWPLPRGTHLRGKGGCS